MCIYRGSEWLVCRWVFRGFLVRLSIPLLFAFVRFPLPVRS
ncbi:MULTISPECIES: hypothetical protein [Proteus]|nr:MULTISPECIES: hypothetical protein [Proteus]